MLSEGMETLIISPQNSLLCPPPLPLLRLGLSPAHSPPRPSTSSPRSLVLRVPPFPFDSTEKKTIVAATSSAEDEETAKAKKEVNHSRTFLDVCTEQDKIIKLPGQPEVSFQQYSGYITIDEKQQRALFFYFVEAETEPASKPLVLWLTGGPGCSSLSGGAFNEHGPFRPREGMLVKHEYSWNKEANMLYLESPAGVGFSYSANKSFYSFVNDEITARDNLAFLEGWLAKFPEYENRDFFITGESYAGHFVPQLAELFIQSSLKMMNLKGIALGNPSLEFDTDLNSRAGYLWSHGMISDSAYKSLTSVCNFSQILRQNLSGYITPICSEIERNVLRQVSTFINVLDVNLEVCLSSVVSESQKMTEKEDTEKLDVCIAKVITKYLNRADVQAALHAQLVGVDSWMSCSRIIKYDLRDKETPTIHVLGTLVKNSIRVMVFSGDQDAVNPLTGTRTLIEGLAMELGLKTTVPYRAWFEGRQVAGWTQVYGDILSFATIRGGGHLASYQQPERSLAMFRGFLAGKPLPEA